MRGAIRASVFSLDLLYLNESHRTFMPTCPMSSLKKCPEGPSSLLTQESWKTSTPTDSILMGLATYSKPEWPCHQSTTSAVTMSASSPCDRRRQPGPYPRGSCASCQSELNRADQLSRLWEPAWVRRTESGCIWSRAKMQRRRGGSLGKRGESGVSHPTRQGQDQVRDSICNYVHQTKSSRSNGVEGSLS